LLLKVLFNICAWRFFYFGYFPFSVFGLLVGLRTVLFSSENIFKRGKTQQENAKKNAKTFMEKGKK